MNGPRRVEHITSQIPRPASAYVVGSGHQEAPILCLAPLIYHSVTVIDLIPRVSDQSRLQNTTAHSCFLPEPNA